MDTLRHQPIEEIKTVCFVGAGQMGCFNSLVAASAGYIAKVFDQSPEVLASLPDRQRALADYLTQQKVLDGNLLETAKQRVVLCYDIVEAVADADLVSESVPERLESKRDILAQCDRICPPKTILTTNTSSMLVSELETSVDRGDRIAALHSYLGSLLFDIVGGPRTAPKTLQVLEQYVRSLNGIPMVYAKELRGYVANFLFGALNSGALTLVINEVASLQDIDRAWMYYQKARSGPFGIMDYVGLDVVSDVTAQQSPHTTLAQNSESTLEFLRPYLDSGHLGVKTGQGFYSYPEPEYLDPNFLTAQPANRELYVKLFERLIAAAILLVIRGDATIENVDLAWTTTTRSPLGPFATLKSIWPEIISEELTTQLAKILPDGYLQKIKQFLQQLF